MQRNMLFETNYIVIKKQDCASNSVIFHKQTLC